MIREARGFGSDISEAQENARIQLGAGPEDDVQFEIIQQSKKKVLGIFGGCKAEVRAYIELPEENIAKEKKAAKKTAVSKDRRSEVSKPSVPREDEKARVKKTPVKQNALNLLDESEFSSDSKAGTAISYLRKILISLGCSNLKIKALETEEEVVIEIDGDGLGTVIGRRGETLDALQYLVSLAANNKGGYFKVSLDICNYREKREQTLISLSRRVSDQVLKSGRSRALEPMNPYERRIIHTAVQDMPGVSSHSVGSGSSRRVVISLEGSENDPLPVKAYSDRKRTSRGGRDRRPPVKKQSNTVATAPTREPKRDSDIPLYGKIN